MKHLWSNIIISFESCWYFRAFSLKTAACWGWKQRYESRSSEPEKPFEAGQLNNKLKVTAKLYKVLEEQQIQVIIFWGFIIKSDHLTLSFY